jgi:hypothetical protein
MLARDLAEAAPDRDQPIACCELIWLERTTDRGLPTAARPAMNSSYNRSSHRQTTRDLDFGVIGQLQAAEA